MPDDLKSLVKEQVDVRGGASGKYVFESIRQDQERLKLRGWLLAGAASNPTATANAVYFDGLRARVRKGAEPGDLS